MPPSFMKGALFLCPNKANISSMKSSLMRILIGLIGLAAVVFIVAVIIIKSDANEKSVPVAATTSAGLLKELQDNLPHVTKVLFQKTIAYDRKKNPPGGFQNSDMTGWNMNKQLSEDEQKKMIEAMKKISTITPNANSGKFPSYNLIVYYQNQGPRGGGQLPPPYSIDLPLEALTDTDRDAIMKIMMEKNAEFIGAKTP